MVSCPKTGFLLLGQLGQPIIGLVFLVGNHLNSCPDSVLRKTDFKVCIIYLQTDGLPQPLNQGGCTVHTGRTLHYTNGNKTNRPRRAYIVNYRNVMGRAKPR